LAEKDSPCAREAAHAKPCGKPQQGAPRRAAARAVARRPLRRFFPGHLIRRNTRCGETAA